ncbi:hypothetical protein F4808DRAFT_466644 [Astrocystis sublimbata]|nr:hypothetical protein F4808DRAFT_466644 [Astrocystis sublimbata]
MSMLDEPQIRVDIDPYGRRGQIQRHFWYLEHESQTLQQTLTEKINSLNSLKNDQYQKVHDAAHTAYDSLVAVVDSLLTLESGGRRIARVDKTIVDKLEQVVANFAKLSEISKQNAWELGVGATQCMVLGDGATTFVGDLDLRMVTLNSQISGIWTIKQQADNDLNFLQLEESDRRRGVDRARDGRNDGGNKFLGFFDSGVIERLDRDVRNAESRLAENQQRQNQTRDKITTYYQLTMFHKNASAAIAGIKDQVKVLAAEFDTEFKRVIDAQKAEDRLWGGLLDLRNKVLSSDFVSTRDNSLRVILELLQLDDGIDLNHDCLEAAELKIKGKVCARLGDNAVIELTAPIQCSLEDFVTSL